MNIRLLDRPTPDKWGKQGGRAGAGPAESASLTARSTGLAELLVSREEEGRHPVLRHPDKVGACSQTAGKAPEGVICRQRQGQLGPGVPGDFQASGKRGFRVWLTARVSKG